MFLIVYSDMRDLPSTFCFLSYFYLRRKKGGSCRLLSLDGLFGRRTEGDVEAAERKALETCRNIRRIQNMKIRNFDGKSKKSLSAPRFRGQRQKPPRF